MWEKADRIIHIVFLAIVFLVLVGNMVVSIITKPEPKPLLIRGVSIEKIIYLRNIDN